MVVFQRAYYFVSGRTFKQLLLDSFYLSHYRIIQNTVQK